MESELLSAKFVIAIFDETPLFDSNSLVVLLADSFDSVMVPFLFSKIITGQLKNKPVDQIQRAMTILDKACNRASKIFLGTSSDISGTSNCHLLCNYPVNFLDTLCCARAV